MPYWDCIQERAFKVLNKMNRLSTASWRIKPSIHKTLYSTIVERIVLYAVPVWYNCKVVLAKRLQSLQRSLLLWVTKCYKTVSTDALKVLAGVLPLDVRAEIYRDFTTLVRWNKSVSDTASS